MATQSPPVPQVPTPRPAPEAVTDAEVSAALLLAADSELKQCCRLAARDAGLTALLCVAVLLVYAYDLALLLAG